MKAIVIGAGWSIIKNVRIVIPYLKQLDNDGDTLFFVTDKMLRSVVAWGINPEKIIVATVEETTKWNGGWYNRWAVPLAEAFYGTISKETAAKITVHLSCLVTQHFVNYLEWKGFKIGQSFHRFPTRCLRQIDEDSPIIRDGANVGMGCISIAATMYHIKHIASLGIDLVKSEYDGQYSYNWDPELQNSLLALPKIQDENAQIYNINPGHYGRFFSPIKKSDFDEFKKIKS